ncbi:putative G-protein coupled receptor 132 [Scleropages formosus]|uniref:Putative G-protein coupled receptor 132 n=1 Tax=Scleropages formosus TaxID=113540 RepID=A0A0P7VCH3_SCLFO|nr:probable G-protein coupled receptor 132 [Scleropages formosus]KPP80182.1 putative G-protein coupled receptor 132 [Scleropages formosus]
MENKTCNFSLHVDIVGLKSIYSVAFSLGLPSNLLSLWGLYKVGLSNGGIQLVFLFNLMLSDLLQLLTLPLWMLYLDKRHHWEYKSFTCNSLAYIFYVNLYASVGFLCLTALDRYLAIVHPLSSRGVRQVRVAIVSGLVIWISMFFFCMTGLYPTVYDDTSCLCLENYPVTQRYACFKIATVILGFLLPCAVLGYTSTRIAVALRNSPSILDNDRHKIVGTLIIIIVIFVVIFGPYHLVGAYKFVAFFLVEDKCQLEQALFLCYRLCYGLTSLNNLLNPLLYIFMCTDTRHKLKESLPCLGCSKDTGEKTPAEINDRNTALTCETKM